jgi:hypothetical protein
VDHCGHVAFCGIHILEIQSLADNENSIRIVGFDPIASSQLTLEEIHRGDGVKRLKSILKSLKSKE